MPADDGSEPIDVATDINDNLERLDNTVGFVPSTSSTPPVAPYDGMATYETDTGAAKFRGVGGVWNYLVSAGSQFLSNLLLGVGRKIGIGQTNPSAYLDIIQPSGTIGGNVIHIRNTDQINPRLRLAMDSLQLGDGALPPDVGFLRTSYGQIDIVGSVNMSNVSVSGNLSTDSLDVTNDLDVGGNVVSPLTVLGKLSGTGYNVVNVIRKPSDSTRTNTIILTDDPHLTFYAEANTSYFVQLYLQYSGTAATDLRTAWSAPAGTTGTRWVIGEAPAQTDHSNALMRTAVHVYTTEVVVGSHTTALYTGSMETMLITTASTAGNVTLRYAQGTASVDAITIRVGTMMTYQKVE
jgi:hypothetical protein